MSGTTSFFRNDTDTHIVKAEMKKKYILIVTALCAMILAAGSCKQDNGQAKYIFLMIGDGMGETHVAAAESYLSYEKGRFGGEQLTFTQFPVLGSCTTYSANSEVTCSSASGTAIASGYKTNNDLIGLNPEGEPLKSIAYILKEQGYKVGIMSSVPVNHATPASFYAHNGNRNDYYNISMEIPESGFDFFGGSGFIHYYGKKGEKDGIDRFLQDNGYTVCYGEREFEEKSDDCDKVIFIQNSGKGKEARLYNADGKKEDGDIDLGEMLDLAIDYLGDKQPFFIMCEGGEIDWCAHENKTMPMIKAVMNFDDAVAEAYKFYLKHPDETLIVVTADHETGGITLGGAQHVYKLTWEAIAEEWETSGEANFLNSKDNEELNRKGNIGWTTHAHTGGPVPVYAIGKGAERFAGRIDNTDIIKKIVLK